MRLPVCIGGAHDVREMSDGGRERGRGMDGWRGKEEGRVFTGRLRREGLEGRKGNRRKERLRRCRMEEGGN
jgi:hypothetical protein